MRCGRFGVGAAAIAVLIILSCFQGGAQEKPRVVHVIVCLADNVHQGIVKIPDRLGDGDDPAGNLYWGARYGVKSFFRRSESWALVTTRPQPAEGILERCVFKHARANIFLVADAYRGKLIKQAIGDFLDTVSGNRADKERVADGPNSIDLDTGSAAGLVVYIGHNGLMDFSLEGFPRSKDEKCREAVVLACLSKKYFSEPFRSASVRPVLWTTGLMAPEAYTLEAALEGWVLRESADEIRQRAAKAYAHYQKTGLEAAKRLLVAGW